MDTLDYKPHLPGVMSYYISWAFIDNKRSQLAGMFPLADKCDGA